MYTQEKIGLCDNDHQLAARGPNAAHRTIQSGPWIMFFFFFFFFFKFLFCVSSLQSVCPENSALPINIVGDPCFTVIVAYEVGYHAMNSHRHESLTVYTPFLLTHIK